MCVAPGSVNWVKTASLGHIPDMTKLPKVAKIFQRFEECCRVFSTLPITDPLTCQVLTKSCFAFSCSGWVGGSPALAIAQIFCIFCTRRAFLAPGFVSGWVNLLIFVFHLDSTQGICNFWFFWRRSWSRLLGWLVWLNYWRHLCDCYDGDCALLKAGGISCSQKVLKREFQGAGQALERRLQKCRLITSYFWLGRIRGPDDIKIEIQLKT